jgi:hypothetical protein
MEGTAGGKKKSIKKYLLTIARTRIPVYITRIPDQDRSIIFVSRSLL